MSTLVGMELSGRYRLDAQIGAGGMSTVYRAFDQTLERRVAIKLMHREIASDSDQLERFRREARAVAQLSHPHIVGVIDAGEDEGRPYIVLEYVEGETLKERIRRMGRLPMDEAIAYAIEIARALGCAHSHHIVHRDVKPQNVLIDAEGSAKVTDFGIARTLDQEGLTADGRVLGTTDYVSPEQALGHDVNGQSDIYSLGVVLFEMLTGDVPFHGENQVVGGDEARPRGHARPAVAPAGGVGHARLGARPHDRQGPRAPLPGRRTRWSPTSRRRWRSRPRARAGRPARRPRCCARCPASARRRLPFRLRHTLPVLARDRPARGRRVAVVVLLVKEGVDRAQRGTGPATSRPPAGEQVVSVARTSANDYDPLGDDEEHPEQAPLAVDRDPDTTWRPRATAAASRPSKAGVGIYVDAKPGVEAVRMEIQTPSPAGRRRSTAPRAAASPETPRGGWTADRRRHRRTTTSASGSRAGGKRYRYYLVWITELPPGAKRVEIAEISLFRDAAA